jgi:hypothetical protein
MLMLQRAITDLLRLVSSAAGDLDVVAVFVDRDQTTYAVEGDGLTPTTITTATTTTIVAAPASGKTRNVKGIMVRNVSATVTNDVTLLIELSGAVQYELYKATLLPGATLAYVEGTGFVTLAAAGTGYGDTIDRQLDAAQTGTNATGAQNWIPTGGAASVEAGVVYAFEGILNLTRSAGAVSHTTSLVFGGTATLTSILWRAQTNTGDTLANAVGNHAAGRVATAVVVKAASVSASEEISILVHGSVKINAAGTFIPQFQYSAAPGGAPTIQIGTRFTLTKKGSGFNTKGTWV